MRFMSKPHPVDAVRFDGSNVTELQDLVVPHGAQVCIMPHGVVLLTCICSFDLEVGDWVIVNANGAVFMADAEAFDRSYEAVQ